MNNNVLKLDWMGKAHKYTNSGNDVTINIYTTGAEKSKGERKDINITFRNGMADIFGTGFIELAIFKNRIYFRGTDEKNGIKLVRTTKENNAYARFGFEAYVNKIIPFVGSYELKYDDFHEIYYIETDSLNS